MRSAGWSFSEKDKIARIPISDMQNPIKNVIILCHAKLVHFLPGMSHFSYGASKTFHESSQFADSLLSLKA